MIQDYHNQERVGTRQVTVYAGARASGIGPFGPHFKPENGAQRAIKD